MLMMVGNFRLVKYIIIICVALDFGSKFDEVINIASITILQAAGLCINLSRYFASYGAGSLGSPGSK